MIKSEEKVVCENNIIKNKKQYVENYMIKPKEKVFGEQSSLNTPKNLWKLHDKIQNL